MNIILIIIYSIILMKKVQTKFSPPLTVEERSLLFKFRDLLDNEEIEYDEDYFTDTILIRFLRARKLNLKDSFKMFTEYLKWRKEEDIDYIKTFEFPEEDKIKQYYPHTFHNTDKLGRPLYIEKWNNINLKR